MLPTHVDTHMGAVATPQFIPAYVQLASLYRLPPMIFRLDEAGWQAETGMDPDTAALAAQLVVQLEATGLPLLDHIVGLSLEDPADRLGQARQAFDGLKPGLTHFIIHPAKDTPELRAITPDWRCRVADFETFLKEELRRSIKEMGIQVIGYRVIKALMESA
jgi:hypothetical protein